VAERGGGGDGMRQAGAYLGLAFMMPTCTLIGYGMGYLLDKAFGTHFLWAVFLGFGIAAGFIEVYRVVSRDTTGDGSKK
jgi:F0F1-type ATP synthase assembly protein I